MLSPILALILASPPAQAQGLTSARDKAHTAFSLEFSREGVTDTSVGLASRFQDACEAGYNPACRHTSWLVDGRGSLEKAKEVLEPSCESGDEVACLVVAWALEEEAESSRVPANRDRDYRRAALLLKVSCDAGFQPACHDYGWFLYENKGLTADPRAALNRWKTACTAAHAPACRTLAVLHRDGGPGIRPNAREAEKFAKLSCDGGDAEGCTLLADLTGSEWLQPQRDEWFTNLCEQGHAESCWTLARSYYDGKAPEPEEGRTLELFERACDLFHPRACFEAGRWYAEQDVGDDKTAAELYGKACALGDVAACTSQTDLILADRVEGSVKTNVGAFEAACEDRESTRACTALAIALIDGLEVPRDAERGRELLHRSCTDEGSEVVACAMLARSYAEGLGGPRDRTVASKYYRWTCNAGDLESCRERGDLLTSDVGVRRDDHEALNMYERACETDPVACYKGGEILRIATYVAQDFDRAAELYTKACDGEVHRGCTGLGRVHEAKQEQDFLSARSAYAKAIDLGSREAKRRLARLLWNGWGGPAQRGKAKGLCRDACQAGDAQACKGPAQLTD